MTELTVADIATLCGAPLVGAELAAHGAGVITGPASLEEAVAGELSFLGNQRYAPALETTHASAVLVPEGTQVERDDLLLLPCANPNRAFTRVVEAYRAPQPTPALGVDPGAHVDPSATIEAGAFVGAGAIVGANAHVAAGAVLHSGAVLGPGSSVGRDTHIHPCAVVGWNVQVGERCIIHAGTVLGSDGFGFEPTATGWVKIPQCGTVVVDDDVEMGANCSIDRGRFGATRIGRGAKLDNLVHVAHNVVVGPNVLLIAQVGLAGSAKLGEWCIIAGQAGVGGHVTVGPKARVAGQTGVSKDVEGGHDYFGTPVQRREVVFRQMAEVRRLPKLVQRVKDLEARLAALESEQTSAQTSTLASQTKAAGEQQ
ncbi:MAG: UDP-3-O-[3-hydroxymyristoyl] glucosamine N-acyltransferase [Planctomycetota bacterium]|jgi:UDP-3-O-[3-hydroxymyristoyl] glucosamine N-acyltransferase